MPRFVILEHDHPCGRHFDFMLEFGDVLKTWAIPEPPSIGVEQWAEPLPDHRPAYLDYEGPVSGDRGTVAQWDRGEYQVVEQSEKRIVVDLRGEKINAQAELKVEGDSERRWTLVMRNVRG
jgi:hypothetical protein